jgi:hypothetical protein
MKIPTPYVLTALLIIVAASDSPSDLILYIIDYLITFAFFSSSSL